MEWLGLVLWVLALMLASAAAAAALSAPSLGLLAPLALGGLAACVVYLIAGDGWLAWISAGLALIAGSAAGRGAAALTSDAPHATRAGSALEEHAAASVGAIIPLLLTNAFVMTLAAVGVTTVG